MDGTRYGSPFLEVELPGGESICSAAQLEHAARAGQLHELTKHLIADACAVVEVRAQQPGEGIAHNGGWGHSGGKQRGLQVSAWPQHDGPRILAWRVMLGVWAGFGQQTGQRST